MSSDLTTAFADKVSGAGVQTDAPTGADTMGISATDPIDDPTEVHQLSQAAYDELHPVDDSTASDGSGDAVEPSPESGGGSGVGDVGQVPTMPPGDVTYGSASGGNYLTDDASKAKTIVNFARSMLGVPYVWGGNSRQGTDCSGLVQQAYRAAGIEMPRLSNYQMDKGKRVDYKNLKPGDLVGWNNSNHVVGADHIAIYIGNNQIIEAARPGTDIRVSGLFDYDVGQMWAVRVPGAHVAPQRIVAPKPQTATQVRQSGGSVRAQEAASTAASKPKPKKKPAAPSAPRRMSLE